MKHTNIWESKEQLITSINNYTLTHVNDKKLDNLNVDRLKKSFKKTAGFYTIENGKVAVPLIVSTIVSAIDKRYILSTVAMNSKWTLVQVSLLNALRFIDKAGDSFTLLRHFGDLLCKRYHYVNSTLLTNYVNKYSERIVTPEAGVSSIDDTQITPPPDWYVTKPIGIHYIDGRELKNYLFELQQTKVINTSLLFKENDGQQRYIFKSKGKLPNKLVAILTNDWTAELVNLLKYRLHKLHLAV